jgi:hypothetical protein
MGLGKILVIGGVVAGGAYLLMKHASATTAGATLVPNASVPPGWAPPASATVVNLQPAATPVNKPLTLASWPADPGQPPGQYVVIWDASNANSFVALFYANDPTTGKPSSTPAVMAQGTTTDSSLILQQIATISGAVQGQNAAKAA